MKDMRSCGAHSSSWHRMLVQAAVPSQALGWHPPPSLELSRAIPRAPRLCFLSAFHRDSSSQLLLLAGHRERKPHCSAGKAPGFLHYLSPGLQGSEHKPVQPHRSRSALAHGAAVLFPAHICSSSPVPQHTRTRFCLPWLQNQPQPSSSTGHAQH